MTAFYSLRPAGGRNGLPGAGGYDGAVVPEDHPILSGLNEQQQAAVLHFEGPALVIAGAGSGKTRTVVQRIAWLIEEHGVLPQQIMAVTFTNKAAGELRERVQQLTGASARDVWVSTFHGACLRVLRSYGEYIGLEPGFVIFDDADQLDLLRDILGTVQGLDEVNPRLLRSLIDRAKSNMWTPDMLGSVAAQLFTGYGGSSLSVELLSEVYSRYEGRLRSHNGVDFNDILGRTVELFDAHPEILARVQQRTVFLHVDEYQDTNHAQYRLTNQLASRDRNLMVVGDPDQSVYSFRGADIGNILDFQKDFTDAVVYRLELNYRSTGSVIGVANALIRENVSRLDKDLKAVKGDGEQVRLYRALDHRNEAEFVTRQIDRLLASGDYSLNDFAVLYRTNSQSRTVEEAMRRAGLEANIVGGVGFYDRLEVKDVLAYARAALNPADDLAWRRILNRPRRGIGKTSEDRLNAWASRRGVRFSDAVRAADEVLRGTPAAKRVAEFTALLDELQAAADSLGASQFLKLILDASGYRDSLKKEGTFEAEARLENLDELVNAVIEWEEEDGGGALSDFLDEAALLGSVDDRAVKAVNGEVAEEAVTLMTLHNAKGLEFRVVFLLGLEEGLIPHRSSVHSLQEVEEERRLLYVGITRAQEQLFLQYCETRMTFGRTETVRPSRFLQDIPRSSLTEVDVFGQELGGGVSPNRVHRSSWQGATVPQAPPRESAAAPKAVSFRGGERVRHPRFGLGTIVGVAGEGNRVELTVVFDEAGARRLSARYANLAPA